MSMIGGNKWIHNIIQYLYLVLIYEINSKPSNSKCFVQHGGCPAIKWFYALFWYDTFGFRTVCCIYPTVHVTFTDDMISSVS
jgi:hypothetical protein